MVSTVIFDVDGTLAETEEYHRRAFNEAFKDAGLAWAWDEALYRELLKVTGGKERIAHFMALFAPPMPADEGARMVPALHARKTEIYTTYIAEGVVPLRPGIGEFIEAASAKGLGLAIATTTSLPNIEALLTSAYGVNWRRMFPIVVAGDMVERKKPAPDAYLIALEQLGRPASECIAIEDSKNGVAAALGADLRVIAVRSTYCRDDDLSAATWCLTDCRGLTLDILDALDRV